MLKQEEELMKIAHLFNVPPPYGGIATYGHETSRGLAGSNHQIYAFPKKENKRIDRSFLNEINYKLIFNNVTPRNFVKIIFGFLNALHRFLSTSSLKINKTLKAIQLTLIQKNPISILKFYLHFFLILNVCQSNKVESIIGHHPNNRGMKAVLVGKALSIPTYVFVHGGAIFFDSDTSTIHKIKVKWILKNSDYLLFCSENSIERALELGADREKIFHVGLGVDKFKYRSYDEEENDSFTIGFTGYLSPRRGLKQLLIASSEIRENIPDFKIVIAGRDPYDYWEDVLEPLAKELNLRDKVTYLGQISEEEHRELLSRIDLFSLLIMKRKTGSLASCLESQSAGIPILTTGLGGLYEYVIPNETAIICDREVSDICQGLKEAYNRHLEKKWNHQRIRKWALKHSWDRVSNNLENVIRKNLRS